MSVQITIIGTGQIGASIGLALGEQKDMFLRVGHEFNSVGHFMILDLLYHVSDKKGRLLMRVSTFSQDQMGGIIDA